MSVTLPKLIRITAATSLLALTLAAHAQNWTLKWSDEFNAAAGTFPDPKNWTYDLGDNGFGNPELEYYCAPGSNKAPCSASKPNVYQDGEGHLVITASRDAAGKWTSARLKSQGLQQFKYGRIEARMKLPVGNGLWPAFWMLGANIDSTPWPACGEQDIIEWVQSFGPNTTSSTTHGPGFSGAQGPTGRYPFPAGSRIDDFHVYGVLWGPDFIQYYRDNLSNVFLTLTRATMPPGGSWPFNNPFFLLLNLAIGKGGFPGVTDATTPASASMLVDFVRVYLPTSAARNLNGSHTLTPQRSPTLHLENQKASTASNNPILVSPANSGPSQTWSINNAGVSPAGAYNLATGGAFCLTAPSATSGSAAVLTPCNGSPAQSWNAVSTGGTFQLSPANNPTNCLDARASTPGAAVQVATCSSAPPQQWAISQ